MWGTSLRSPGKKTAHIRERSEKKKKKKKKEKKTDRLSDVQGLPSVLDCSRVSSPRMIITRVNVSGAILLPRASRFPGIEAKGAAKEAIVVDKVLHVRLGGGVHRACQY